MTDKPPKPKKKPPGWRKVLAWKKERPSPKDIEKAEAVRARVKF